MKSLFKIFLATAFILLASVTVLSAFEVTPNPVILSATAGALIAISFITSKKIQGARETISPEQARGLYTQAVVAVYSEMPIVYSFLRSFFPKKVSRTKYVSISVRRGTEKVAVDVIRGTKGNKNKRTKSTEKIILPPYYNEGFNVNELDIYDASMAPNATTDTILDLADESAEMLIECRNKIERAYEKQVADLFETGVIELVNGDNIDFNRKAGSMVTLGAGAWWSVTTVDPMVALEAGGKFIREEGKAQGVAYNVIMGGLALNAMLNNPIFQAKYDIKNVTPGEISMPERMSSGGTLHGKVSAGSYIFYIWTYPEGYDVNGTFTPYIPDKNIVIIPENPKFVTAFAQVPMLQGDPAFTATEGGDYVIKDYIDADHTNHVTELLSAGVSIPVQVDAIYTAQVLA